MRVFLKFQIDLNGFSHKSQKILHFWGAHVPGPGPVRGGPWPGEKPIFGAVRNRESSPRCTSMFSQRAKITEIDPPKMHYSPVRSVEASHWTKVHLGEVWISKNGFLGGHFNAPRGSLTISVRPRDRVLHGQCGGLGDCLSLRGFEIGMEKWAYS